MALRQQVWVDRSVQGVLVGRVLLYWLCAILYVGIGSACFQYNQNPEWTLAKHAYVLFGQMWPWLPTVVLVLPLAIYDVVRLSNLFVGPVYRLRKHFGALRQDIACAPLTFREDDYWRDLAAPINDMQAEILRLRTGVIELQQVASQTSALMANFKANLPDEQASTESPAIPRTLSDTLVDADPNGDVESRSSADLTGKAEAGSPATSVPVAEAAPFVDASPQVSSPLSDSNPDQTVPSTITEASNASEEIAAADAPPAGRVDQVASSALPKEEESSKAVSEPAEDIAAEVSIAPLPVASLATAAAEATATPAV